MYNQMCIVIELPDTIEMRGDGEGGGAEGWEKAAEEKSRKILTCTQNEMENH